MAELSANKSGQSVQQEISLLLAGVACWLLVFPYRGIYHDAQLYSLLALNQLHPDWYGADPFLINTYQSDFTIFPVIYSFAIDILGVNVASLSMTLAAGMLWVLASRFLTKSALGMAGGAAAFLLLVGIWLPYHPNAAAQNFFHVSENFISPRLPSQSLSLIGLALFLRRAKGWKSASCHALAIVLHPLMGIWAALLQTMVTLGERRVFVLSIMVFCTFLVLSAGNFLDSYIMPEEWLILVRATDQSAFIGPGSDFRLGHIFWMCGILLLAAKYGMPRMSRIYAMTCLMTLYFVLVFAVLSLYAPVIVGLQLQVWRVLWLTTVMAVIAAADALSNGPKATEFPHRLAPLVILVLFPYRDYLWGIFGGLAILLSWGISRYGSLLAGCEFSASFLRGIYAIAAFVAMLWITGAAMDLSINGDGWQNDGDFRSFITGVVRRGGYGLLPLLACWLVTCSSAFRYAAVPGAGMVLVALLFWDARTNHMRLIEENYLRDGATSGLFSQKIGRGETIYWENNPGRVWFGIGGASYASRVQVAGIIFSEKVALEMKARLVRVAAYPLFGLPIPTNLNAGETQRNRETLSVLSSVGNWDGNLARLANTGSWGLTPQGLRVLCADHRLAWVVTKSRLDDFAYQVEKDYGEDRHAYWFLYDCRTVRFGPRLASAGPQRKFI